jgi:four helix bundle protein
MIDFKKLRVWQIAHEATLKIYKLTSGLPRSELLGLISQLRRAAVSVELNIAESEGRFNRKEKIQFFYMSRASSVEVRAALEIVRDLYPGLIIKCDEIIETYKSFEAQLNSLIGYRKKS